MRVVIASDSFKGTLTSLDANQAIKDGILAVTKDVDVITLPMSDGGDGSLEVVHHYVGGDLIQEKTKDPLFRDIEAKWLKIGDKAYIEVAQASGLSLLGEELSPMESSSYGTGLQIKSAIEKGCTEINLLLGGSATTDGGCGILSALGVRLLNNKGKSFIPTGGTLNKIHDIGYRSSSNSLKDIRFRLLTDVTNPLLGANGTAHTYANQKGASSIQVKILEENMTYLNRVLTRITSIDNSLLSGTGAAGGIPIGILAFLDCDIVAGFEFFDSISGISKEIADSQLVITGEGRFDSQSLEGKVVGNVLDLANKYEKQVLILCGKVMDDVQGNSNVIIRGVNAKEKPTDSAVAAKELSSLAEEVYRDFYS